MQQAIQTEATKRAIAYMNQQGIKHTFNWDAPTSEDFDVWEQLRHAGVLVDRRGQQCRIVNRYGPNPHGIESTADLNAKYGGAY